MQCATYVAPLIFYLSLKKGKFKIKTKISKSFQKEMEILEEVNYYMTVYALQENYFSTIFVFFSDFF